MDLDCRKIKFSEAQEFYNQYEHLGHPGRGVYHFGAFISGNLVSAVSYGTPCFGMHRGIIVEIAKRNNVKIIQLTRGGTINQITKNIPSWIIGKSLSLIQKTYGDCLVVAYSDPKYNEIGTIYQACNFVYLGKTNPKGQSDYIINGIKMSGWKVRRIFGTRSLTFLKKIDPKVKRIPLTEKYRYIYPATNKHIRRKIEKELISLSKEYPKREYEGIKSMNIKLLIRERQLNMKIE